VNRSVVPTLRRTAEGGVLLALGFGALIASPQPPVSVMASASASSVSVLAPLPASDQRPRPQGIALRSSPSPSASAPSIKVSPIAMAVATTAVPVKRNPRRPPLVPVAKPVHAVAAQPGSATNAFAYGYCTWWVAHKRAVPWRGDAAQWWWSARAFGYAEGSTPRVGAIMVMAAGGAAAPEGHVAYVESVNANGSFVVSEMNWWGVRGGGWGRVDYRTVTSMRGILGFIY
jgi:surface antigen